jgi:membrane-associated phospholipid phosphatase
VEHVSTVSDVGGTRSGADVASPAEAVRLAVRVWAIVVAFALVTLARSEQVGVGLRDPDGQMFRGRLTSAVGLLLALIAADAIVRTIRAGWSWRGLLEALRSRWSTQRLALVGSGLLAYHVVYVCYRNLKSWDTFNAPRDGDLLSFEKAIFFGHSPAVLLHQLLGYDEAAHVLSVVYRSFTYLIPLSVVGTLALLPRIRQAYVFLCSAMWLWILGTASYYLIPTLGPFASAPSEFSRLTATAITETQVKYLAERSHMLADPSAGDAFVSISAFASLHVAFTCLVMLVAYHYGWRRTSRVLLVYLAAVMVSTIYFGWHFVVDDVAGVILAFVALWLGRWTVYPRGRRVEDDRIVAEPRIVEEDGIAEEGRAG